MSGCLQCIPWCETALATPAGSGAPAMHVTYLELGLSAAQREEASSYSAALEPFARPARVRASRKLRAPIDRLASIAAGVLVDIAAAPFLPGGRAAIAVAQEGKPDFVASSGLHFSLSHSRSAVCCAVSDGCVGVDVEPIVWEYEDVCPLCLTESESEFVCAQETRESRARAFTRIWTRKEAVGKWFGCGLKNFVLHTDMLQWPRGCEDVLKHRSDAGAAMSIPMVTTFDSPIACVSTCGGNAVHVSTMTLESVIAVASSMAAASWKEEQQWTHR